MSKHYKGDVSKDEVVEFQVPVCKEIPLEYSAIESQMRFLEGKVLTIIDASYGDLVQRKAIKDLIKGVFGSQMSWIYELCGYPRDITENVKSMTAQEAAVNLIR